MSDVETKLVISDTDRPLAFLELSDLALGRFARSFLIQIERAVHKHAGNKEIPTSIAMSMHGAIALYRMAADANAGEMHLKHEGVEWGGERHGDWEVIVRRQSASDCLKCVGCGEYFPDLEVDEDGAAGCEACFTEDGSGQCHAPAMLTEREKAS